jgi:hypothetical protein
VTLVCRPCSTPGGCHKHKLFTCETCGRLTPWSDGCDDEFWRDCSACWLSKRDAAVALVSGVVDSVLALFRIWP